jgi:hypothetical protein
MPASTAACAGSRGGVDSQDRDACFNKVLEQISVIAGSFDHQAVCIQVALLHDIQRTLPEVLSKDFETEEK